MYLPGVGHIRILKIRTTVSRGSVGQSQALVLMSALSMHQQRLDWNPYRASKVMSISSMQELLVRMRNTGIFGSDELSPCNRCVFIRFQCRRTWSETP